MNNSLDQFIAVMRQAHGLDVSRFDESFLVKTLAHRQAATAHPDAAAYLRRLAAERAEAEEIFQSLNIGFSEFFRNPLTFAVLEQLILPGLVEAAETSGRREIRVWSAGCAAGQEAYSVAILLDELAAARGRAIPFRIFATDIAEAGLAAARRGVYDAAAVRQVRWRHLENYFARQGEMYEVAPWIRDRVDFSALDLLDGHKASPPASIFGDFQLVLCCNLLFYYRPEPRRDILNKVRQGVAAKGYLVTGEAERDMVEKAGGFRAVAPPAAVFQKTNRNVSHGLHG
jgi:chemotaxis protein methyltransferase CheR